MADSESSDVLANLPAGRPTRRSSRRAPAAQESAAPAARKTAPTATKAAAKKPAAKKPAAAAKPAAAKKQPAAKKAAAKKPAAKKAAAKKPAAKKAAAKKAAAKKAAAPTPVSVAATTAGETAARAPRRPRIQTPPEGRRADYSAGSATHRARRVTTNRPWLPASGFVLPDEGQTNQLAAALGGLGSALADVARLSLGIAQSLTVKRREIQAPEETSLTEE